MIYIENTYNEIEGPSIIYTLEEDNECDINLLIL